MLHVKEAVRKSLQSFGELFPDETERGLRLEEVSLDDAEKNWEITLSFKNPEFEEAVAAAKKLAPSGIQGMFGPERSDVPYRFYKTLAIRAEDGELVGVRNEWDLMQ